MKKVTIILALIIVYTLVGIFFFRDVVDTEVGFKTLYINDQQWQIGKTLDGSYHVGELIVYEAEEEVFRYQTAFQNSIYRDMIFDHNMVYILGYQFTKDQTIDTVIVTMIDLAFQVIEETTFTIVGEIYPTRILANQDEVYVLASYTGETFEGYDVTPVGEYDVLVMTLSRTLEVQAMHKTGESLSDLVTDAYLDEDVLYIAYNEFDSLVEGNLEESNQGKIIRFDLLTHLFTEQPLVLTSDKLRVQGFVKGNDILTYFGNFLDSETQTMTPFLCEGDTCSIFSNLEVNANCIDVVRIESGYIGLLQFEQYGYSDVYGEITRKMVFSLTDDSFSLEAMDQDIYIQSLLEHEGTVYATGYIIEKHLIKADRTRYYDDILYVKETNH